MEKFLKKLSISQIIVVGFLATLLIGGSFLALPLASNTNSFTPAIDAFFTAASALFVTGQTTLNTAEHFSYFGKTVIIVLIEIGGLGVMTIVSLFFLLMGKSIDIKGKKLIQESLNIEDGSMAKTLVKYVIMFSLSIQAIFSILFSFVYIPMLGLKKGIYYSIFHSISAFNNAGFDLFGDSLAGFVNNSYILLLTAALILIGGLGFIVWYDLINYRKNKDLSLHTELVLRVSAIILVISFTLFFISETLNNTFTDLSLGNKIANIIFLSVTPRTAGFYVLDYNLISKAGIFLTFILMFIGGSSGSTAGGFKITTLSVLIIYLISSLQRKEARYRKRSISNLRIERTFILLLIALISITSSIFLLLLTQDLNGFGMDAILMEVFSCFSTVGLSLGITPFLNSFGKFILIVLMFMGRIGTLTVLLSLNPRDKDSKVHYPEGKILIG